MIEIARKVLWYRFVGHAEMEDLFSAYFCRCLISELCIVDGDLGSYQSCFYKFVAKKKEIAFLICLWLHA